MIEVFISKTIAKHQWNMNEIMTHVGRIWASNDLTFFLKASLGTCYLCNNTLYTNTQVIYVNSYFDVTGFTITSLKR